MRKIAATFAALVLASCAPSYAGAGDNTPTAERVGRAGEVYVYRLIDVFGTCYVAKQDGYPPSLACH